MVQSPIFVIACRSSVLTSPHVQVHDNGEGLIDAMPHWWVGVRRRERSRLRLPTCIFFLGIPSLIEMLGC
jgi:hypothetical protein